MAYTMFMHPIGDSPFKAKIRHGSNYHMIDIIDGSQNINLFFTAESELTAFVKDLCNQLPKDPPALDHSLINAGGIPEKTFTGGHGNEVFIPSSQGEP
jgi:hypothetical protein